MQTSRLLFPVVLLLIIAALFIELPDANHAIIRHDAISNETKPRETIINYKVQEGDTLSTLANKFEIPVDTIRRANDMQNDNIVVGTTIRIPLVDPQTFPLTPGQVLMVPDGVK